MDELADEVMRADEVARRLRVSARRVRTIPAAELPYVQLDERGVRRYSRRAVERYIEARTVRS